MFAKATRNFVGQIDPDGCLIPVTRVNDSDKLLLLSVVVKSKPIWFWKPPKYIPSNFTLNDVLVGDKEIKPVTIESEFLKYEGTYGDTKRAKLETGVRQINFNLEGETSSKLLSSFGTMKKQEMDVQKFLQDSKDRLMNVDHCLIKQTRGHHKEVFGVVKERILTTEPCSIYEQVQEQGDCAASLGFHKFKKVQVSVSNSGSLYTDSKVSVEIPPQTVIAYSIIELEVKASGKYEPCLLPEVRGGFEVDSSLGPRLVIDGLSVTELQNDPLSSGAAELGILLKDLEGLHTHFQQLAALPAHIKCRLFQILQEIMLDREKLTWLEDMLDWHYQGERIALGQPEWGFPLKQTAQEILHLLRPPETETTKNPPPSTPLLAVHMLVSAMEEMSDAALAALGDCCSPLLLKVLQDLVEIFKQSEEDCLKGQVPAHLLDEGIFERAAQLCHCCKVTLRREADCIRAEARQRPGLSPLLLCVVVRGLAFLCTE